MTPHPQERRDVRRMASNLAGVLYACLAGQERAVRGLDAHDTPAEQFSRERGVHRGVGEGNLEQPCRDDVVIATACVTVSDRCFQR